MSPTSYQAALPRVIPSLLSATLIIIPYSNGFVKRVRKVFLQRKQRAKTRLPTFFPENQQPRQFTPLREGRRRSTPCAAAWAYFNSRPSARGDWNETHVGKTHPKFQFTPLREGRLTCPSQIPSSLIFQFTPLREGRRAPSSFQDTLIVFQFTPLREGRRAALLG